MKKVNLNQSLLIFVIIVIFLFVSQALVEALSVESITEITDSANYGGAKFSPDGTKIAAVSDRGLEVMELDGSNKEVIVKDKYIFYYSWSPDGKKIAFVTVSGKKGKIRNIWVVNVDGTGLKQLTSGGNDENPTWSPDGTKIVFDRGEGVEWSEPPKVYNSIWIINADGTELKRLTPFKEEFSHPLFSPDGTKIACIRGWFAREFMVCILDKDGNLLKELVKGMPPTRWSSDGEKIWTSTQIIDVIEATSAPFPSGEEYGFPVLSPDWNWVCYEVSKMGEGAGDSICIDSQLYIINRDGTGKIQVTDEYGMIYTPSDWSPDGSSILASKARGPLMEEFGELPSSVIIIKLKK